MKFLLKLIVILAVLGGVVVGGGVYLKQVIAERNKPQFRTGEAIRGTIEITRNATGEVKPVLSLHVGSFVSGPIEELFVDFNDEVEKGELLATIDPRIYKAAVASNNAALSNRKAEVERVQAQLQQAVNDEKRANALKAENENFISQTELDQFRFARMALDAQLVIANASVLEAKANLENAETNLDYTHIVAPAAGTITERMIDPGQTLAAQFNAPELFIISPDMKEKIHIFASIDEADIGLIRAAKDAGKGVIFKVEAYPGDVFTEGTIEQIRLSPVNNQNVVTYPVVVATPNKDMKLLPGMTAQLTFQIEEHEDILMVPSAAVRYMPDNKAWVHEEDHDKLDLSFSLDNETEGNLADKPLNTEASRATEKAHVWVQRGEKLKAIAVELGVNDYKYREVVSGDLKEGDKVVVGLKTRE